MWPACGDGGELGGGGKLARGGDAWAVGEELTAVGAGGAGGADGVDGEGCDCDGGGGEGRRGNDAAPPCGVVVLCVGFSISKVVGSSTGRSFFGDGKSSPRQE